MLQSVIVRTTGLWIYLVATNINGVTMHYSSIVQYLTLYAEESW